MTKFSREQLESALDAHRLYFKMTKEKYWQVRRNGKTQTWKTRPDEFRIPIKIGFKSYGAITENNLDSDFEIR